MNRILSIAIVASFVLVAHARAEQPARFKFSKGQELTYNVVQTTKASETLIDEKTNKPVETENLTKHTVVRRWKAVDVDQAGVATLQMTILSLKWERKLPDGKMDVFDSTKPDKLNEEEMAKLIGPVLAEIRVDGTGKVVEVKQVRQGAPNRFGIELPFKIMLPESGPKEGQTWERPFTIKLDPPHGTGESYEAVQKYTAKAPVNSFATIGISTSIKEMPAQASDQIPLLPMLLEGDVYFQESTGKYYAARLKMKKELVNHAGDGSKYVFETVYLEDLKTE